MAQTDQKNKSKHQLDLLEEKQAFVVIALTDRLSHAGKLVAINALAHYNSERGYSWASIPVVAEESGYSPHSTKSISPGFSEIKKVGAFRVVRTPASKGGKKSSTYRCCPIMPWFRDEYERLRRAGKIEDDSDPFADLRSDNDNMRQGKSPGVSDESPGHTGQIALSDRANNPVTQGKSPEEENRLKGTDRTEQKKEHSAASRRKEPADGLNDDDGVLPQQGANDNAIQDDGDSESKVAPWPDDMVEKFQRHYCKGGDISKISNELDKIKREGRTEYKDVLRGASNYSREQSGVEVRYIKQPETFLRDRLYTGYQRDNRPKPKCNVAI